MSETVVTFLGLCALIDRNPTYEVYLPTGKVLPPDSTGPAGE